MGGSAIGAEVRIRKQHTCQLPPVGFLYTELSSPAWNRTAVELPPFPSPN